MVNYIPEMTGVIILGDSGFNFWLSNEDYYCKKRAAETGYNIYCVRGNHEARPEDLGYGLQWDKNVRGVVYVDKDFPTIRYFMDGGEYTIDNHSVLTIGGAYSVDKWYRLRQAGVENAKNPDYYNPKKTGWFPNECLDEDEMYMIEKKISNKHFDFVFTHTCPLSWEPTDLFINGINQSTVDKSMEKWLDSVKDKIDWNTWLFGHFHADRVERERVEQFYMDYDELKTIWNRWNGEKTYEQEWQLEKSSNFSNGK